jgi:hypothetical protein
MKRSVLTNVSSLGALLMLVLAQPACGGAATDTPASTPDAVVKSDGDAPSGDDDVVQADFVDPLAGFGAWVDVAPYGKAWQPSEDVVGADFVPYGTDGSWATNDDGDWVFVSKHDDDFGWATYHYGRWVVSDDYGWVWIPGTTWAPAWVEWRFGGGNTGWAPVGPDGVASSQDHWVVVEDKHFLDDGAVRYRLDGDHVSAAWDATPALTETRGSAHWIGGPPAEHFKAFGTIRTVHMKKPAKGATKLHAKASIKKAGGKTFAQAKKKPPSVKAAAKTPPGVPAKAPPKKAPPPKKK